MTKTLSPEQQMAAALGGKTYDGKPAAAPAVVLPMERHRPTLVQQELAVGLVHLGDTELGAKIGVDVHKLIEGRLVIQGSSGAGKSWTLRRLIEQTWGNVQQIIIDPEGEFKQLAEQLQILYVEAHHLDIGTLAITASRIREHRISIVLDVSELDRDAQMSHVTAFIKALIDAPREHWHPVLVVVDEAHLFAPKGGYTEATAIKKMSVAVMTDLMSRGRKRGLASVLATQRFVRLSTSVTSEAHSFMIGLNTLDLDIKRASDAIGWSHSKGQDQLPYLKPGEFVVVGPAFSASPVVVKVGSVQTKHVGATPAMGAPQALAPAAAAKVMDLDVLLAMSRADEEVREERAIAPGRRVVRQFIRDPAFSETGRIWAALKKVAPEGLQISDIAKHLNRKQADIASALALLDSYNVLEFQGEGEDRAVRIATEMLS